MSRAIQLRVPAHLAARIQALAERAGWSARDDGASIAEAAARKLLKVAVTEAELDLDWLTMPTDEAS